MSVLTTVRQRALNQLFGNGFGAFAAATATGWLVDQLRKAFDDSGERLDTARLRPGESYIVTTRPPLGRRERSLVDARKKIDSRIKRATVASPRAVKAARSYNAAMKKAERAREGSRRKARRVRRVDRLGSALDQRLEPSPKTRQLMEKRAEIDAEIIELETAARRSATKVRRPSAPRTFR